jgi:chaperone required for assembly of F1-ATPase
MSEELNDILSAGEANGQGGPTRVAEPSRESQLPKRFYKDVSVLLEDENRFTLALDDKPVRTPGRMPLAVDSKPIADATAAEWSAQGERIDPMTMPLTRLLNTAIDGVANEAQAVKEDIVRYAGTDLLCYRATGPEGLIARQRALWDPLLEWAQTFHNAPLTIAEGIAPISQPKGSILLLGARLDRVKSPVLLTALHLITSLTGSAVIAFALLDDAVSGEAAWTAAHVDEDWNIEEWGEDEEAKARRDLRWRDMETALFVVENLR